MLRMKHTPSDTSKLSCMSCKKPKLTAMDIPKRVTFACRDEIIGKEYDVKAGSGVMVELWDGKDDLDVGMAAAPLTMFNGDISVKPVFAEVEPCKLKSWNNELREDLLANASMKWETLEPHLYCCKEVVQIYTKPDMYDIPFNSIDSVMKETKRGVMNGSMTPRLGVTIAITHMFDLLTLHQMKMEKYKQQDKFDDTLLLQSVEMLCAMKESVYYVGWYGRDSMEETSVSTYEYETEDADSVS